MRPPTLHVRSAARVIAAALLLAPGLPRSVAAQETSQVGAESAAAMVERARELRKEGLDDQAAELLEQAITTAKANGESATLRDAYLQLIETYETWGNREYVSKGRVAAAAFYDKSRSVIEECLRHPDLRHAQPDSTALDQMIQHFAEVRSRIFGKLRVDRIEPIDAEVLLDGSPLGVAPGDTRLGEDDLLADQAHELVVRRDGYEERRETIDILPGETTNRAVVLAKKRSGWWYAGWGAGLAAVVGGTLALTAGGGDETTPAQPLPGPPPPPAR